MPGNVLQRMRAIAEYREMVKTLRHGAVGCLAFGVLALVGGTLGASESFLALILLALGALLVIDGVLALARPSSTGLILHGVCFAAIGIWNIGVTLLSLAAVGFQGDEFFLLLGAAQIIIGVHFFRRYPRFARLSTEKPNRDVLRQLDEIAKGIRKAKPKKNEDIIEFTSQGFTKTATWRGRLGVEALTLVARKKHGILFAAPHEVTIDRLGKVLLGKTLKVAVKVPGKTLKGTMSPESYERFAAWKAAAKAEAPSEYTADAEGNR